MVIILWLYSPLSKPCAWVEQWVPRLQLYEVHIPGKDNTADPLLTLLGRSATKETHENGTEEYVRFVATNATPKALTTKEVL